MRAWLGVLTAAAVVTLGVPVRAIDAQGLGTAPKIRQQNGIAYTSGGVGADEHQAMLDIGRDFNLKVALATPSGEFQGPVQLRVEDQRKSTVLDVVTDGPLFMAKLPAGRYTIHATAGRRSMTQSVTVPAQGQEQLTMTWPESPPSRAGDAPSGSDLPDEAP